MKEKLRSLTEKLKITVFSYPIVLAMAAIMASTIIYMIETEHSMVKEFWPVRIIIVSALGISLLFALTMLAQRTGKQLWGALGIMFLVGYYFLLPETEAGFTQMHLFMVIPTFILSHLLVAVAPFTGKQPEANFWQYNKNLFVNLFLTTVFTGVLTGGVELAIVAVDQLFNMNFDGKLYAEVFFALSVVGSVLIFLLFDEKGIEYLEKDSKYPVVLKFFTQFILIPLLLIYVVILYFYSAKIVFRWELPQGWVSYLVLAYSIVGILALLLVHPLKDDSAKSWVKIFGKLFYFSLLPLLALLFTAIFTRLLEYGFTEPRYYVLLLAIWLLSVVMYFILAKRPTIRFIPLSLFLFGFFSLVFPYLNTFSVSKRSQKHELEKVLQANKLLVNGKIDFDRPVPAELAYSISDKFEYLSERFEYDYLRSLTDAKAQKSFGDSKTWRVQHLFTKKTDDIAKRRSNIQLNNSMKFTKVDGYQYAITQDHFQGGFEIGGDHFILRNELYKTPMSFVLEINDEKANLMPAIKKLIDKYGRDGDAVQTDSLFVETDLGRYHIKVIFDDVNKSVYEADVNYYFSGALFLVRKK